MPVVMDHDVLSAAGALETGNPAKNPTTNGVSGVRGVDSADIEPHVDHEQHKPANWVDIRDEFLGKPHRRLKVVTIGAGFSGKSEDGGCRYHGHLPD